ncbi:MAG TPA: YMGG-like glycine zipper-containing protein [Candidatus Sulfotelmatobacter sp.]|nr:YMGG-like glycine zipper-containing protein [Candidatus Sulfotelmatobacter sp.]
MKQIKVTVLGLAAVSFLVEGCATPPMGPTAFAARGPNVSEQQYQQDQNICMSHAGAVTKQLADEANNRAVGAGVIGTLAGAALGAAVGGGRGAAIGAASGAAVGGSIGASQSNWSNLSLQRRYDSLYLQCMAATGNSVPYYYVPPPVAYYYQGPGVVYYAPPPPPPAYAPAPAYVTPNPVPPPPSGGTITPQQ